MFISYSHDSEDHRERVLDLGDRLCSEGVDVKLDRYETSPAEGWPRWMRECIEGADFVLVVCTRTYLRRFQGREESGRGLGSAWEGAILTQDLYQAGGINTRLIPVTFSSDDVDHIPDSAFRDTDRRLSRMWQTEGAAGWSIGSPRSGGRAEVGLTPGQMVADRYEVKVLSQRDVDPSVYRRYIAHDRWLDEDVALLFMSPNPDCAPDYQNQVGQFVRLLRRVVHPNALPVFEMGPLEKGFYIVRELVDYRKLGEVVKENGPMPFIRIKQSLHSIISVLKVAHRQGVLHLSLSSYTVKLEGVRIWISDLGIVQFVDPMRSQGLVIETVETVDGRVRSVGRRRCAAAPGCLSPPACWPWWVAATWPTVSCSTLPIPPP